MTHLFDSESRAFFLRGGEILSLKIQCKETKWLRQEKSYLEDYASNKTMQYKHTVSGPFPIQTLIQWVGPGHLDFLSSSSHDSVAQQS